MGRGGEEEGGRDCAGRTWSNIGCGGWRRVGGWRRWSNTGSGEGGGWEGRGREGRRWSVGRTSGVEWRDGWSEEEKDEEKEEEYYREVAEE